MNNDNKHVLELSVHQIVDFLLRVGDIDSRVFNSDSMKEGTLIHNLYQSKQGPNYISEYALSINIPYENILYKIQGRADGIIEHKNNKYIIDEIKSCTIDLNQFYESNSAWHLGQAKFYAYMFATERQLNEIGIRLTYIRQGNLKEKQVHDFNFKYEELEQFIYDMLDEYTRFYNVVLRLNVDRNNSIESLNFPFDKYRDGQRKLAKYSYAVAKKGGNLFVEAPTGIGKTMSTLFPFIKALLLDDECKIFYLTAKTSGKENASKAIKILSSKGLKARDIVITAKEKICFCKDKKCNPDECPFAQGYYTKIKNVIKESISIVEHFDQQTIEDIATANTLCPFELELDLSLFCDVIICDYNYMFDPISYMKRYFDEDSSHHIALIDEAHNLIDRSRGMYSAKLSKSTFENAKKSMRHVANKAIKNVLSKVKKVFDDFEAVENGKHEYLDIDHKHYLVLRNFCDKYLSESKEHSYDITDELTTLFVEINRFLRIVEFFNDNYVFYIDKNDDDLSFNLVCLDASKFLKRRLSNLKASVIFSATLSPIEYYIDLLGGDKENDPRIQLESPFPKGNLELYIAPKVSTKYKNRDSSYKEIYDYIKTFLTQGPGNYFVYVPSYEYLDKIQKFFDFDDGVCLHIQKRDMSEEEKNSFLNNFQPNPTKVNVGVLVLGGIFSEGIDLVNDRLSGIVIIGIGLAKLNYESDKISELFTRGGKNGYMYAYLYPAMNKVMQAIGRLIRTETDKGKVLLIDERYMTADYQNLYQKRYKQYEVVLSPEDFKNYLK